MEISMGSGNGLSTFSTITYRTTVTTTDTARQIGIAFLGYQGARAASSHTPPSTPITVRIQGRGPEITLRSLSHSTSRSLEREPALRRRLGATGKIAGV